MEVVVPYGLSPGETLSVRATDGRLVKLTIPPGVVGGMTIKATVPPKPPPPPSRPRQATLQEQLVSSAPTPSSQMHYNGITTPQTATPVSSLNGGGGGSGSSNNQGAFASGSGSASFSTLEAWGKLLGDGPLSEAVVGTDDALSMVRESLRVLLTGT